MLRVARLVRGASTTDSFTEPVAGDGVDTDVLNFDGENVVLTGQSTQLSSVIEGTLKDAIGTSRQRRWTGRSQGIQKGPLKGLPREPKGSKGPPRDPQGDPRCPR